MGASGRVDMVVMVVVVVSLVVVVVVAVIVVIAVVVVVAVVVDVWLVVVVVEVRDDCASDTLTLASCLPQACGKC